MTTKNINGRELKIDDEDSYLLETMNWFVLEGYATASIIINGSRRMVKMHRLIADAPKDLKVDHINADRLDNRRANLRLCHSRDNSANASVHFDSSSGVKGVDRWPDGRGWRCRIFRDGKSHYIGTFSTVEEAGAAYFAKAKELFGEFASDGNR